MPELPEVETIVQALAPRLTGRHIVSAELLAPLVFRHWPGASAEELIGRRITEVKRHGKHILITLDAGLLILHLGMTGKLLFDVPVGPHTPAVFGLDDSILLYEDIRMFGSIEYRQELPKRIASLGPEPLDITPESFYASPHRSHA